MVAAYIDPSSMTYLIQIIAGVVIAAGAGVGFYWKRIRRSLRNKKQEQDAAADTGAVVSDTAEGETITAEMLRAEAQDASDKSKQE